MLKRFLSGLALLALASCSSPPPAPKAADADPALWVLKDEDTTVYLFGSVHALKPGLTWFDEAVKQAFDASDTLVLELVLPPGDQLQALIRELGVSQDKSLSTQLSKADLKRLHEALRAQGMPLDAMEGLEPWLAAVQLSNMPTRAAGYDIASGVEAVLGAEAAKTGKPVIGLETAREQFGYFDRLSLPAQRQLLSLTMSALPAGASRLDMVVAAWAAGDTDKIARLLNGDLKDSPELAQALIVTRNGHWADWVGARMKQPGTVFIAVGAGHLTGDMSVQAELARRGFQVARISY